MISGSSELSGDFTNDIYDGYKVYDEYEVYEFNGIFSHLYTA